MRILNAGRVVQEFLDLSTDNKACVHWGQSGEDAVLHRMFRDTRDGFYVDVGAHHPRRFSNTHLLHKSMGWSGINIDANQDAIDAFEKECPGDINLCALVGFESDPVVFTKFKSAARNTAVASRAKRLSKKLEVLGRVRMTPRPLSAILDEHLPAGRTIDLMSVDAEGMDVQVLRTNDWDRFRPSVVCVEDFEFRKGAQGEIWELMDSLGYVRVSHCFDTSIYQVRQDELGAPNA